MFPKDTPLAPPQTGAPWQIVGKVGGGRWAVGSGQLAVGSRQWGEWGSGCSLFVVRWVWVWVWVRG
ncbi:MAG: hypothetical protein D6765_17135 [Bacteroidetes bacterium]|nr:MAG: hypothetical protein D6765_17135 [Bacteroidota bacterium]